RLQIENDLSLDILLQERDALARTLGQFREQGLQRQRRFAGVDLIAFVALLRRNLFAGAVRRIEDHVERPLPRLPDGRLGLGEYQHKRWLRLEACRVALLDIEDAAKAVELHHGGGLADELAHHLAKLRRALVEVLRIEE